MLYCTFNIKFFVYTLVLNKKVKIIWSFFMPLYEYECDSCMEDYNNDIDELVAKLNKTTANKIFKRNKNFCYIEITDREKKETIIELGEKDVRDTRRFLYNLDKGKSLYLELKNFRFSELITDKEDEKKVKCPLCNKKKDVRRIFSTFKAIFDDKNKRAPRPGDDLKFHMDYKVMKDEEKASNWVGQDHLNQYFNR